MPCKTVCSREQAPQVRTLHLPHQQEEARHQRKRGDGPLSLCPVASGWLWRSTTARAEVSELSCGASRMRCLARSASAPPRESANHASTGSCAARQARSRNSPSSSASPPVLVCPITRACCSAWPRSTPPHPGRLRGRAPEQTSALAARLDAAATIDATMVTILSTDTNNLRLLDRRLGVSSNLDSKG